MSGQIENGRARNGRFNLRYIIEGLIAALLGLLAFIGGSWVESERGLHAEQGAIMRHAAEQDMMLASLRAEVQQCHKDSDTLRSRLDEFLDGEATVRRELKNWKPK